MKTLMKIIKLGLVGGFNALALLMVVQTANSACIWVMHQPDFPEEAKKLKKF